MKKKKIKNKRFILEQDFTKNWLYTRGYSKGRGDTIIHIKEEVEKIPVYDSDGDVDYYVSRFKNEVIKIIKEMKK